jgi:hypothetical protein
MKARIKIKLLLLFLCLLPALRAQVTIGIVEEPAEGALLQLKSIANAALDNKNAEKGLLIPRVELKNYRSLEPFISNASPEKMKEHVGLIVYNLTQDTHLKAGIAVWNGSEWDNIKSNETKIKDTDMEVKKTLYDSTSPIESDSVSANSIEISMREGKSQKYYAFPQFRITDLYKPSGNDSLKYQYQTAQYWTNKDSKGYSNDVEVRSFGAGNYSVYQNFIDSDMSVNERNEVWMYDEKDNKIFHIEFFVMGKSTENDTKIYAIFVEQF